MEIQSDGQNSFNTLFISSVPTQIEDKEIRQKLQFLEKKQTENEKQFVKINEQLKTLQDQNKSIQDQNRILQQQLEEQSNKISTIISIQLVMNQRYCQIEQKFDQKIPLIKKKTDILIYPPKQEEDDHKNNILTKQEETDNRVQQIQQQEPIIKQLNDDTSASVFSLRQIKKFKRKKDQSLQESDQLKKIPGKNVPLFIGTRLKNCLRFDCPIKFQVKQWIEETSYTYDEFLKWLDDPLMKLKEIWHFSITWTIYKKESEKEKFFKKMFKRASLMFLDSYAINSIIWSGQSLHSLTVSNANIKKPAVLKKIGKFLQGLNNTEKLKGMFNEKKEEE